MTGRDEMLARIRKALGRPAQPDTAFRPPTPFLPELGAVMPPVSPAELVSKFEEELRLVGGAPHLASTQAELEGILRKILEAAQAASVVLSRNPMLSQLRLAEKIQGWGKGVEVWPPESEHAAASDEAQSFREQAFLAEVGITGVDWALAETGSVVLTSATEGSQLASLAPPVHVTLYRRSQVLGSLEEVLERLPVPRLPSQPSLGRSVVFITGTSRTADIEQILVRGVHGPREVHAILVEETCFS